MLNDNPKLSNKMKFFEKQDGTWLARIRSNQCHSFHSNDAINIGIVKEDYDELTIKAYIQMKNNKLQPVKPCENHAEKFGTKVSNITLETQN